MVRKMMNLWTLIHIL